MPFDIQVNTQKTTALTGVIHHLICPHLQGYHYQLVLWLWAQSQKRKESTWKRTCSTYYLILLPLLSWR